MKLSTGQEKAGSEISGNISVAWFTASVIAPFFLPQISLEEISLKIIIGLVLSVVFAIISLVMVRNIK